MSSKKFVLTSALFTATLAAIAEGTSVEKHAAQAVSFGVCTDAKAFVTAFEAMSVGKAESLSYTRRAGAVLERVFGGEPAGTRAASWWGTRSAPLMTSSRALAAAR